jgi:hypothetical protein
MTSLNPNAIRKIAHFAGGRLDIPNGGSSRAQRRMSPLTMPRGQKHPPLQEVGGHGNRITHSWFGRFAD